MASPRRSCPRKRALRGYITTHRPKLEVRQDVRSFARHMREEGGGAAVEFALVLPILVLLVFGIVEFGGAFNTDLSVTHAAREGARLAAVGNWDKAVVEARATPLTVGGGLDVADPVYGSDPDLGDYVEITVSYPYDLGIPLWGDVGIVSIESTARMKMETDVP